MIDSVVGNYRIAEKVGEGGMGAVYRAIDLMLEREVAIKAIRPELARDAEIVERFRAEAKLAARVSHPAIATIYSFFVEGEDLFLAMEFVRGRTLSRLLQESGPLPWEQAVALLDMALDGIDRAHRAGIVHRDLKPDNLMITELGTVKVMDFGIARATGTGRLTRTGLLIGTLRYMAPEQIRGEDVDRRTDVYSLGTVLYETLTGRVPFDGASDYAVLKAQVEDTPTPPSQTLPGLPSRLDQAILKALAKDPAERFQTVEEMRRFLLGQGSAAATLPLAAVAAAASTTTGLAWSRILAEQPTLATTPTPLPGKAPVAGGGGADDAGSAGGRQGAAAAALPPTTALPATAAASSGPRVSSYRDVSLLPNAATRRRIAPVAALVFALLLATALLVTFLRRAPAAHSLAAPGAAALAGPAGAAPGAVPATGAMGVSAVGAAGMASLPATAAGIAGNAGTASGGDAAAPASAAQATAQTGADAAHPRRRQKAAQAAAGGGDGASQTGGTVAADAGAQAAPDAAGGAGTSGTSASPVAGAAGGDASATGPDAAMELRRLGTEIVLASDDLRQLYGESLAHRNLAARHNVTTPAEETLKEQLRTLHATAEHFREPFGGGFMARTRARFGRLSHGEDESQQIKRLAHELSDSVARVDTAMAEAQPAGAVTKAWHHLHHLCDRVEAICNQ
jgi:eukaryotic-like serine/threonine-protein kinase